MKTFSVLSWFICCVIVSGCSSLTLSPVHYQWPVESVLTVDEKGMVDETRYNMTFNVKSLLFDETADSVHVSGIELRIIRDASGYYYITAPKFKNVYVFASDEGKLKLEKAAQTLRPRILNTVPLASGMFIISTRKPRSSFITVLLKMSRHN